ncbi:hypothetical protein MHK_007970 [Candidatus Magnetomorum sp. HK-1]|nr:hypothetical protein MHK_007970 [Candidatus Magnetomorum sp. HK-1]
MQTNQIRKKLLKEISIMPDHQINDLYDMIHSHRLRLTMSEREKRGYAGQVFKNIKTKENVKTYTSLKEGYKAMSSDIAYEKEANDWIFDECGECLPDTQEDWDGWNE